MRCLQARSTLHRLFWQEKQRSKSHRRLRITQNPDIQWLVGSSPRLLRLGKGSDKKRRLEFVRIPERLRLPVRAPSTPAQYYTIKLTPSSHSWPCMILHFLQYFYPCVTQQLLWSGGEVMYCTLSSPNTDVSPAHPTVQRLPRCANGPFAYSTEGRSFRDPRLLGFTHLARQPGYEDEADDSIHPYNVLFQSWNFGMW